jgi:hypothetical protein
MIAETPTGRRSAEDEVTVTLNVYKLARTDFGVNSTKTPEIYREKGSS